MKKAVSCTGSGLFVFAAATSPSSLTYQQQVKPLALVTGDLLADFYEEWLFPHREQIRQLHQTTLLRSVARLEAQGAYHEAVTYVQLLLTHEPTHELAHQHLMVCYERLGDREPVIRQYETCRRVLAEELGVDPAPETRALYRRILTAAAPPSVPLHTTLLRSTHHPHRHHLIGQFLIFATTTK